MNLLLIHSLVRDQEIIIDSLTADTKYIIINYERDDLQTLKDKISAFNLSFERVGLFQENDNMPYYQLTIKFHRSILIDVETLDVDLDTWAEFKDLLDFCKNLNMTNFDMMDCNIASDKNWDYIIRYIENKLSININASSNETGNSAMQGDWVLEKGNVNLIGTYFTENIKNYKYTLGGAGYYHSLVLADDGSVYACGYNNRGQLGNGNNTINTSNYKLEQMIKPTNLGETTKAINIAAGSYHSLVLYDDGSVYACGYNNFGQLGKGNNTINTSNYTLTQMIKPTNLGETTKAINIAAGYLHSLVLYDDGSVYACGYNYYGQLGKGNNTSNTSNYTLEQMIKPTNLGETTKAINIAAGGYHSLVIYSDGSVYACGDNNFGQLGKGNNTINTSNYTLAQMIKPTNLGETTKAINIAVGGSYSLVLYDDGSVYACGNNIYGQFGIGPPLNIYYTLIQMIKPTNLGETTKAINIAAGGYHSLVIYNDGSVYACGDNNFGQLGSGNIDNKYTLAQMIKPTNLGETTKAIDIATGLYHSLVIYNDGSVYACGYNNYGQLGKGNNTINTFNYTLAQMLYNNNNIITNFNIASTATFATIFFNPSALTKTYNGITNLTLTPSMYEIYSYNPLQPTIIIDTYTAIFNNKNVGTNKTLTINITQLKDNENNTNYLFVIPYTTEGIIIALTLTGTFNNTLKVYDGNRNTSSNFLFIPSNVISDDIVTITNLSGEYNTANINANEINNITGTISNTNYLFNITTTEGTITHATITPIFTSIPKQYDGNTNANATYTLDGLVNEDILSITYNAEYNTPYVGNNIRINITGIEFISNIYSSNYVLNNTSTTIYGDIINGNNGNIINNLSQYINRYTTLNMLSRLEVKRTNTAVYYVIGYRNTNILVSVLISN